MDAGDAPANGSVDAGGAPANGSADAGAGPADGSADAAGIVLPPLPPLSCPSPSAPPVTSVPVQACGGQLALSSAVTLGTSPVDHFFRCGAMGPEIATDVRLSPDASRLAALTGASTVRLFATDDWHEIAQLATATGRIDAFAFSPDSRSLATLSMEAGQIVLWDAVTGRPLRTLSGQGTGGGIAPLKVQLAFSHDGSKLVSSLGGIVDLHTGAVVSLPTGTWWVDELAFTACDRMVYGRYDFQVGDSNPTLVISLFDATTGQGQGFYSAWDSDFGGAALSPDGRLLAVSSSYHPGGSSDFDLAIYRADTGEQLAYRPVWTAGHIEAFTPDGSALLVSTPKGTLDEWRLADGKVITSLNFPAGSRILGFPRSDAVMIGSASTAAVYSLEAHFAASYFRWGASSASLSADGAVGAAVAPDGALFHVWRGSDQTPLCEPTAPTATAAVTSFALSGDGKVVAAGKADGIVDLFDSQTHERRASIETIQGPIRQVALSGDGGRVATEIEAGSPVVIWSADGNRLASVAQPATGASYIEQRPMALSPDGRTLGILSSDGRSSTADSWSTTLVDVGSGATTQTIDPMGFWATGAPFSPDSAHLAGRADGAVATWPLGGGLRDDILAAPSQAAGVGNGLALTSDWSLAGAVDDGGIVLWNPLTGNIALDLAVPDVFGNAILSLGTATVAVSEYAGHVHAADYMITHLYDVATGTELRRFDSSTGAVLLTPDGQRGYTLDGPDVIAWCR